MTTIATKPTYKDLCSAHRKWLSQARDYALPCLSKIDNTKYRQETINLHLTLIEVMEEFYTRLKVSKPKQAESFSPQAERTIEAPAVVNGICTFQIIYLHAASFTLKLLDDKGNDPDLEDIYYHKILPLCLDIINNLPSQGGEQ